MSSTNGASDMEPRMVTVNGHQVSVPPWNLQGLLPLERFTRWYIVGFRTPLNNYDEEMLNGMGITTYEDYGDDCHLCKFVDFGLSTPRHHYRSFITHMLPYPSRVVLSPVLQLTSDGSKMPFYVALHPNPSQTPQEVLNILCTRFGAEHLDSQIVGNLLHVKLHPDHIPYVSDIDSVSVVSNADETIPIAASPENGV